MMQLAVCGDVRKWLLKKRLFKRILSRCKKFLREVKAELKKVYLAYQKRTYFLYGNVLFRCHCAALIGFWYSA